MNVMKISNKVYTLKNLFWLIFYMFKFLNTLIKGMQINVTIDVAMYIWLIDTKYQLLCGPCIRNWNLT